MSPQRSCGLVPVPAEKPAALVGDEVDGVDDELELLFGDEVVEVHSNPPRLDHLTTERDLLLEPE